MRTPSSLVVLTWASNFVSLVGWAFFEHRGFVHSVGFAGFLLCVGFWLGLNCDAITGFIRQLFTNSETKGSQ